MNERKTFIGLVLTGILLASCLNSQAFPISTPTLPPVNELIITLNDPETSARQLVLTLFDLEYIEPPPTKTISILLRLMSHDDPWVRVSAINALASMNDAAYCAVPQIAAHLSDKNSFVRTGAAIALDHITHTDLVETYMKFQRGEHGFSYDEPEGRLSGVAREWWNSTGQYQNWLLNQNFCQPQP